jgi:hypothetical protein
MISAAERCNSGGSDRVSAMSKECRIVNGGGGVVAGGYVNHCEQVLDDQNEMVMAASKITVAAGSDQAVASINHRVYPPSSIELNRLKDFAFGNLMMIEEYSSNLSQKNEEILELKKKLEYVSNHLTIIVI